MSPRIYGDGSDSSMGVQLRDFYFQKNALIDLKKEQYFTPLADVTNMPKHFGKTIKSNHYIPMLDDRNINSQGIDAAGALLDMTKYYVFASGALVPDATIATNSAGFTTEALALAAVTDTDNQTVTIGSGNAYGSSKDIGTIVGKLPMLSETGGRVNRMGFTRIQLEGTLEKLGFFDEYTEESTNFDTDAQLLMHINREMIRAAQEMSEDALQIDLLNGVGVHRFTGDAVSKATISGETGAVTEVTYGDFSALAIELDNNRCPKQTKILSGTRMVDTKVIPASRAILIGSELIPTIERMTDYFGDPAFIRATHYAANTTLLNGEIGSIGQFRIVVVPEMQHWAGKGATETTNAGYMATNGKYNIYPMLVVGSESFTTIGFQTSGKNSKFKIYHKKPGPEMVSKEDPFGETGLMSIKWYYGTMITRPERIACIYSVARI